MVGFRAFSSHFGRIVLAPKTCPRQAVHLPLDQCMSGRVATLTVGGILNTAQAGITHTHPKVFTIGKEILTSRRIDALVVYLQDDIRFGKLKQVGAASLLRPGDQQQKTKGRKANRFGWPFHWSVRVERTSHQRLVTGPQSLDSCFRMSASVLRTNTQSASP